MTSPIILSDKMGVNKETSLEDIILSSGKTVEGVKNTLTQCLLGEENNDELSIELGKLIKKISITRIHEIIEKSFKTDEEKIYEILDEMFSDKEDKSSNFFNSNSQIVLEGIHSFKHEQLLDAYFSGKDKAFIIYYRKNGDLKKEEITLRAKFFYSDLLELKKKFDEYNEKYSSCSFILKKDY